MYIWKDCLQPYECWEIDLAVQEKPGSLVQQAQALQLLAHLQNMIMLHPLILDQQQGDHQQQQHSKVSSTSRGTERLSPATAFYLRILSWLPFNKLVA